MRLLFALAVACTGALAHAEYQVYGTVELMGLGKNTGSIRPPGLADVMVCNVNGSDQWLAVRQGPGTEFAILRKIERLAIMRVDSTSRTGNWIYVKAVYRQVSPWGQSLGFTKNLGVSGWAHLDHLCDYTYLRN